MTFYTTSARATSRPFPFDHNHHHRAAFARDAVIAEFGWRHARALDQADFIDRSPVVCRSLRTTI